MVIMTLFHCVYFVYVDLGYATLSEHCGSLVMVVFMVVCNWFIELG